MRSLLSDCIAYFFAVIPVLITWGTMIFVGAHLNNIFWQVVFFLGFPIFAVLILSLTFFTMRSFIPKLSKGIYTVGVNREYLTWLAHLNLIRALHISGLRPLIHSFNIFKFVIYRSLGGKIPYSSRTTIHFELIDLPLIDMGCGVTLGDNVKISCHIIMNGKLILRPTTIGNKCIILSNTEVRPGSMINASETYPIKGEKK